MNETPKAKRWALLYFLLLISLIVLPKAGVDFIQSNTRISVEKTRQENLQALAPLVRGNPIETAKLTEEMRAANAAQAHQIATMQEEMNFLREGMKILLQQKEQKVTSTTTVTTTDSAESYGPPSSNKRQNTMSTPTKPRPDSLQNCPDVDFECQPMENND